MTSFIFLWFIVGFYSWGNNNFGQLGLGHEINKFLPQKVELFADEKIDVSYIETKGSVSSAITNDGKIYTWGQSKVFFPFNQKVLKLFKREEFWAMKIQQQRM